MKRGWGKTLVQSVIMANMIKLAKTFPVLQQRLEAKALEDAGKGPSIVVSDPGITDVVTQTPTS